MDTSTGHQKVDGLDDMGSILWRVENKEEIQVWMVYL